MTDQLNKLQAELKLLERGLIKIETDPYGNIININDEFSAWSGYSPDEVIGEKIYKVLSDLAAIPALTEHIKMYSKLNCSVVFHKKTNEDVKVPLSVTAEFEDGNLKKFIFKILPVSFGASSSNSTEIQELKTELQNIAKEYEDLKERFRKYVKAERRLKRQQQALQFLTHNEELRAGNLTEALKVITQTAAEALKADEVSLWLKDEEDHLICVDIYRTKEDKHFSPDVIIEPENTLKLYNELSSKRYLKDYNAETSYLKKITGEEETHHLIVPIYMENDIVGIIAAKRKDENWEIDEENFLMAIADVVSLALEQGNRKEIELELRSMLESSLAMEEELKQNLEELESTNEQLQQTEAELQGRILALNNSAYVIELDPKGNIIFANESLLYLFNEDFSLLENKHILEIINKEKTKKRYIEQFSSALENAHLWKGELVINTLEEPVWTDTTLTPVMDDNDKLMKFIIVAVDITRQKRQAERIKKALEIAQKQEEELRISRQVLEQANKELQQVQQELLARMQALEASAYIYETDTDGKIIYVSKSLLEVTQYSQEELIGHNFIILRSGRQDEKIYKEQWESLLTGKIWKGELEKRTKEGEYFWVQATKVPVLDTEGKPVKIISVLFDITERKHQEYRLKRQQQALLKLNKHPDITGADPYKAFKTITEIGREILEADRVSIWLFDEENPDILKCVAVSQAPYVEHKYKEGEIIQKDKYPKFFEYIKEHRFISTENILTDPRTEEFAKDIGAKENAPIAEMDATILLGSKVVGVLSVERRKKPVKWTLDEETFATSLADIAGVVLEQKELELSEKLKEAYKKLEEINKELIEQKAELEETHRFLKESLRYAKRIQRNLLPDKATMKKYLKNYFIIYRPKEEVGGDFYWLHVDGTKRIIVIADGTGHGVPGAFITFIGYMLLNQIVVGQKIYNPADILYHLHIGVRKALKQDAEDAKSRDGMDVAICLYDTETRKAVYAGANLPFYYLQNWEVMKIKPDKKSIGGEQMEEERTFTAHEIQLYPGNAIYMLTDGFVDQMGGPEGKRFGTKRFRELILQTQHETMAVQRARLNFAWKEWKGDDEEQLDDVTVFGMKIE